MPVLQGAQDGDLLPLLAGGDPLRAPLEEVHRLAALLGQVRHGLQLLLPELGDLDGLLLLVGGGGSHSLLVGVLEDALEVLRLKCVEDVEEVLARGPFACWIGVG